MILNRIRKGTLINKNIKLKLHKIYRNYKIKKLLNKFHSKYDIKEIINALYYEKKEELDKIIYFIEKEKDNLFYYERNTENVFFEENYNEIIKLLKEKKSFRTKKNLVSALYNLYELLVRIKKKIGVKK